MGYISLGILAFTAISLIFGWLFGLMRGRNRAILRLCLIVLSIVIAIFARETVVGIVMNLDLGGQTIPDMINEALNSGETQLPQAIQDIVFALVEIIIGLVAFFIILLALSFVTWLIVFPICKIFVRKGAKKRVFAGGFVGLLQGLVIAFVVCAPLTGIIIQVDKVAGVQMQGKPLFEIPAEVGTDEYIASAPGKIYDATGSWFFDIVTSTKDASGKNVSIDDTCDVVVAVAGIADSVTQLTSKVDSMTSETATPQEKVDTMKSVGDSLVEIGNSLEDLSGDAQAIVNDLVSSVKEMISGGSEEPLPPEIEELLTDFKVEDLKLASAGHAINGIASYIEKTSDEFETTEPVTQEDVNNIVNGLADNTFIVDLIAGEGESAPQIIEVSEENKAMFEDAVNNTTLDEEQKNTLRELFGIAANG